ncbi:MAG TPA: hypothetical protein VF980_03665 [Thermoanaerobaculia bacterium]
MKRFITLAISIVSVNDLDTPVNAAATFGAMVSFDRGRGRKLDIVVQPRSRDALHVDSQHQL